MYGYNSQNRGWVSVYNEQMDQWFLTLLEVLNPASFISAFTEPFVMVIGIFFFFFLNIGIYFISAQNEPCISCTQNSCVKEQNQENKKEYVLKRLLPFPPKTVLLIIVLEFLTSAEPLRLTERTPGIRSNPG